MRDQRTFDNFSQMPLKIGYSGENAVAGVDIDLSSVLADGWSATLLFRRYGEVNVYEAQNKELEGSTLHVTFTSVDAHVEGRGEATIQLMDGGGAIRKSATTATVVEHALDLTGEAPEPPSAYRTAAQQDAIDAGKLSKSAQAEKTEEMTQPVGVDADGKLWALPGGGGGSSDMAWLPSVDAGGNLSWTKSDTDTPPEPRNITGPQGQKGDTGNTGAQGPQGIQGPKGDTGAAAGFGTPTATVDANVGTPSVTVTASGSDTSKVFSFAFHNLKGQPGADGQDGAPGSPGTPGAPGADGTTPTIGTNGNWFLGSTDTGKPSRGEQGIQGVPGQDGAAGAPGPAGPQGPKGDDGLTTSVTVNGETFTQSGGNINLGTVLRSHQSLSAYRTSAAQDVIDATKADKPTIKTTMDAVATVNTQYFLGTQSAVSITLPSNAAVGSQISAVWYNGATAATLTIQGSTGAPVLDHGYSPSANSRSEINALWDGTYWAVVTNEQAVTA